MLLRDHLAEAQTDSEGTLSIIKFRASEGAIFPQPLQEWEGWAMSFLLDAPPSAFAGRIVTSGCDCARLDPLWEFPKIGDPNIVP